jgi:hypothetical protein
LIHSPVKAQTATNPTISTRKDAILLECVAEKLVRFGQRVGVTPEEMISPLNSGISVKDLLAFLASKSSGAA